MRRAPEILKGGYTVLIKNRVRANEETAPANRKLWNIIWDWSSFEELARRAEDPVNTTKAGRRITLAHWAAVGTEARIDCEGADAHHPEDVSSPA